MRREKKKPRILVSSGEPAGIGPDLIIKLAQIDHQNDLTVIGDPDLLLERAKVLSLPIEVRTASKTGRFQHSNKPEPLKVIPVKLKTTCIAGTLDTRNANYVLEILDIASRECLSKKYDAIVTAPIQKSIINDAGINFSGHTEYFAKRCGDTLPVMLLACPELRVALVTTHLALRDVPDAITSERVEKTISIVIDEMQRRFGIKKPRITVCGLNPHAGEGGHLGTEENTIISPVINKYIKRGHSITGPLPADTAFRPDVRKNTDVFICMYHDQGLPVLKTFGFGEAVNITLGLPIIRTSVDHGTALELAGTNKAECDSLLAAINMANDLANYQLNSADSSNTPETAG
ncbi:MAG: 4-hydroxythreonine-4-phosphate dehydrogenase [marine bacterium B5-7]|nr:MAG: 4-hydroxythreonine-4-phosphate dehydrogenase [marine bacterium B5-7]